MEQDRNFMNSVVIIACKNIFVNTQYFVEFMEQTLKSLVPGYILSINARPTPSPARNVLYRTGSACRGNPYLGPV